MSDAGPTRRGRGAELAARLGAVAAVALAVAAVPALADFGDPSTTAPSDSPRVDTPDDPEFDRCEDDDEQAGSVEACGSYFEEQYGLFGFSPDSARGLTGGRTIYRDCSQLDGRGRAANRQAGDPECAQIGGVRADLAWKYSTGDPETVIAILDTGIRWQEEELVEQVALNGAELPVPRVGRDDPLGGDVPCARFDGGRDDADGDGGVDVLDYACDPRVARPGGDEESDAILDASDLIAAFSDGSDADANGYVDDIAGWDFFDDDNDPFDASSCCSASGHGTGRALEAAADTDNRRGGAGICPECQVMPLRVWDTFVVDSNMFALGVVYATDNGASVVEGAVGGLLNSRFARSAFGYADAKGVALTLVSSDINSANHNYPTNYNEAIYVGGALPDSAPSDCGIPSAPGIGGPELSIPGCREFFDALADIGGGAAPSSTQPPTTSFFRNSNLTQYGGKADIVLMGATGSENTGQASGAAGLLSSYGREIFGAGDPLSGNEIRQLLTMTAEDVLPANTGLIGAPDKAARGWDPHFGYGRVDLAAAMERVRERRIPPEAQIDAPDWFAPINVDRVGPRGVAIEGRAAAPHGRVGSWQVDYACGQDAPDSEFRPLPGVSGSGPVDGVLGRMPRSLLEQLADDCDGSVAHDAGRPAGTLTDPWPADPYPDPDPERHAFQIRLTVRAAGDPQSFGRYRKTLHAYRDDGNHPGWPRPIGSASRAGALVTGSGGETPPRLVDLDRDNRLDVLIGTSSGELHALDARGRPLASWNGGEPVTTGRYSVARRHNAPGSLELEPREPLRAPAVGDISGDGEPDVVATAGERVYAWDRRGRRLAGFPVRVRPALSRPCFAGVAKPCFDADDRLIDEDNHVKRGFFGAPALADLDEDGRLDIVAGSLDQHVYAWDRRGRTLDGFPVELTTDGAPGAEIVTSPAIADLDGDRDPEIVIATNEVLPGDPGGAELPADPDGVIGALAEGGLGSNLVYALEGDGSPVAGEWPVAVGTLAGDILPLVVPGNDAAVLDVDRDGDDEVAVAAATGSTKLVDGDGSPLETFTSGPATSANIFDRSLQVNLADYPVVGDLGGGGGPSVIKGGISLNGVANLLATNQNLPFNHVVQAWDPGSGLYRSGYPTATDDFQLVSQPAVAKVGGPAAERQAIVGTGLYQLHAYGPDGSEPAGWPKFLGGWVQPTPSVGDADGDGRLEVAAVTREGWSFLWDTAVDACGAEGAETNAEWWTFGHDEHGSHAYGTDARPPSRPGPLRMGGGGGRRVLAFEAAGDDLACGSPARYVARGADEPIRSGADFVGARRLAVRSAGAAVTGRRSEAAAAKGAGSARSQALRSGGERQRLRVPGAGRFRFVAVRAVDDAGNVGYLRAASARSVGGGDPGSGDGDDGGGDGGGGGRPSDRGGDAESREDGGALGVGRSSDAGVGAVAAGGGADGSLPFTGHAVAALVLLGVALAVGGRALRRSR